VGKEGAEFPAAASSPDQQKVARMAGDLERWSQRLNTTGDRTVSLEDTNVLAPSFGTRARRVSRADLRLVESLGRLQLQAQASLATQYKSHIEAKLYRKFELFSHPGARSEQRLDASPTLGAGAAQARAAR
jgi:hypothetical protein